MHDQLQRPGDGLLCPIAVLEKDGKILTGLRHYTPDTWKQISVWTIPGGRSDVGESMEQALRRETIEEVGIDDLRIEDFIGELPGVKEGDSILIFFCTTDQDARCMEPEKFSEWRWVPVREYIDDHTYDGFNDAARKMMAEYLEKRFFAAQD